MASRKGAETAGLICAIRSGLLLMTVLGFIGIPLVACKQTARPAGNREANSYLSRERELALPDGKVRRDFSAILFVNELSCPCTRDQCRVAEGIMQTLKEEFSNRVRFETVDYELENEKAKPLLQEYNALFMIPVLVVLKGDRVLWKCDDFSDENAVRSRFEEFIQ